jgi:hypothetical protein
MDIEKQLSKRRQAQSWQIQKGEEKQNANISFDENTKKEIIRPAPALTQRRDYSAPLLSRSICFHRSPASKAVRLRRASPVVLSRLSPGAGGVYENGARH